MAVTKTVRLGLTQWSAGTDPLSRAQLQESFASLEANTAMYTTGTLAARPAPGTPGRFYDVTNAAAGAPTVFYDTGAAWKEVRPDLSGYATTTALTNGLAGKADTSHNHDGAYYTKSVSDNRYLASAAIVADTNLPERLRTPGASVADADLALTTGFYYVATGSASKPSGVVGDYDVFVMAANADYLSQTAYDWNSGTTWRRDRKNKVWSVWLQVVFGNDVRLSNARTPLQHSHPIGDLPVAGSGEVSSSKVPRADDPRLSDSRTPTEHTHDFYSRTASDARYATRTGGGREATAGVPTSGTATLDLALASVFPQGSAQTGALTFAFSNVPAAGQAATITVTLLAGATPYSLTWPSSVKWLGSSPTMRANKALVVTLLTVDGGTTWYGSSAGEL